MPANLKARILVVENHSTIRKIITGVLRQRGYNDIIEVEDGSKALGLLHREKFDFVITEWAIPNLSGLDLLKAIRADPERKNIPVLMITSEAQPHNIKAAALAGVSGYMVKPFAADTLSKQIAKILH
ncbi:MAG: response regulator [Candidatus Lambdaproteobacteria bacterium]|nr:response regulator [Candidatus Lambdaproteobacteria bacterium]